MSSRLTVSIGAASLIILLGVFSITSQTADRAEVIRLAVESGERTWTAAQNPEKRNVSSRELFVYALALCEAKAKMDRLEKLFDVAAQMQDRDPKSKGYGNFRWNWTHPSVQDFNAVDFCMQGGALIWLRHREALPEGARTKLRPILDLAVEGCLRHRVSESYSNIAYMNAGNLILLGESMGNPKAANEGYARLQRAFLFTYYYGTHEYDSPTYYGVDLEDLVIIEAFCQRESGRSQARALLELFWTDIAANWFPPAEKLAGARSRDYDYLRGLGMLDAMMVSYGWPAGKARGSLFAALGKWVPPQSLREMSAAKFPRLVRQSWGIAPENFKTHYLMKDVTLSVAGSRYADRTDIPLVADFAGDRESVRCYFLPDDRFDPYGKVKIAAGPHQKALHLPHFFCGVQRKTDAAALVVYREKDVPKESAQLLSHFVMPFKVDAFWINDQRLDLNEKKPTTIPLTQDALIVARKGTAAVGVRVPWARGIGGGAAVASFAWDGNKYAAVRMTIDHRANVSAAAAEKWTVNPAAAFWVRAASGLANDAAFEQWRKTFAGAKFSISPTANGIQFRAEGAEGPLEVEAQAPYESPKRMNPAPEKVVLELDGDDIGKHILGAVEPAKSLAARQATIKPIAIPDGKGVYWEAEAGEILPTMELGKDAAASEGAFVWIPGEPGGKGSGSGHILWRLTIAKPGKYYVWGRVLTPTPDDDSFRASVSINGKILVPITDWLTGVHAKWEWIPMSLGAKPEKTPTALDLLQGEVSLQILPREDGAKLDRLFITSNPADRPK